MLLTNLFEESTKSAVLGWGRGMGHKGHMLLAKAVLHHAQENNAKPYFVVSRTSLVDPATGQPWADRPTFTKTKDDPLTPEEKLATYRKVFPQNAEVFSVASADASTLDKVLANIAKEGFSKVILIVGEQEKASFSFLTNPDKSGIPPYQRAGLKDLEIISRQDTTEPSSVKDSPDYQEGPRATPMRAVLTDPTKSEEEQFSVWRDAMPDNLSDDEVLDLMNKAKQRMAAVPAIKGRKPVEGQFNESIKTRLIKLEETVRMSAAAKLQRAWEQQQAKSTASRKRGEEYMAQIKQDVANKNKKPDEPKDESVMSFLATPKHSVEKKPPTSSAEMRKYFEKDKPSKPEKTERGDGGKNVQQVYRRSDEDQETPQQQQVRAAITKGMAKWDQSDLATYKSQPTNLHYWAPSGWASGQLDGINSIDPDGTVVIELDDTTTAGLVKKLASLGGMPGVKTRQLKMTFDPAKMKNGVTQGDVSEDTLNELDMFAPRTVYFKMADGNYIKADYRGSEGLTGHKANDNVTFTSMSWVPPNAARSLGLDKFLAKGSEANLGTIGQNAQTIVGTSSAGEGPLGDRTIDVVDFVNSKEDTVPSALKTQVMQWVEKNQSKLQGVAEGRKKKKSSKSMGGYFFPGYGYYSSGDSGEGAGDGGGESKSRGVAEGSINEFAPGAGDEDGGEDPYKYPKPEQYRRSIDFFGQFEADHFDRDDFDDATGVFKGYWGSTPIAYFKFDNPAKTGGDDPGMGWYYEPQSASGSDNTSAKPTVDNADERKQQELSMINAFLKSGNRPNPDSQIGQLMKKYDMLDDLNEFAMSGSDDDGNDGFSDDTLKQLAAQWYNGDEDPRVEQTLAAAGWEIGQDEGYDDTPGVFVVQAGDINGNSYISWPAHELEGLDEAVDPEIEEMYQAMEQLAEEMAARKGVSVDLVWESFEALDDHMLYETAAWRRKEGKSKKGGLNAKGVASYRRENPGSKLQMAVTTKPSKLKKGSKAAKRRKSFCARMGGVKGPMKKPNGKPTRKALALRKWNC